MEKINIDIRLSHILREHVWKSPRKRFQEEAKRTEVGYFEGNQKDVIRFLEETAKRLSDDPALIRFTHMKSQNSVKKRLLVPVPEYLKAYALYKQENGQFINEKRSFVKIVLAKKGTVEYGEFVATGLTIATAYPCSKEEEERALR